MNFENPALSTANDFPAGTRYLSAADIIKESRVSIMVCTSVSVGGFESQSFSTDSKEFEEITLFVFRTKS